MNGFKGMTIQELMELLIKLTRENEIRASECNKSINFLTKSDQPVSEIRLKINELHEKVQGLINENKKFTQLFRELIDFNKFFYENQDFFKEDESKMEGSVANMGFNDFLIDFEALNQEELNKLLEQYIAEEKYEECAKIKKLLEKTAF